MSSICEPLQITEPLCLQDTYLKLVECAPVCATESTDVFDYGNKALSSYIVLFLIVFLLSVILVATRPGASYHTLTQPSWAPSMTTWTFLFAIVLFFTAFAASRIQFFSRNYHHWYGISFVLSILLLLFFFFCIFQLDNFRAGFWVLLISAILLVVTIFLGFNTHRAASLWLLPLLVFQIAVLCETWQIVSLNNL